jgi:hypothetical protein
MRQFLSLLLSVFLLLSSVSPAFAYDSDGDGYSDDVDWCPDEGKGFTLLHTINPTDGFWVNAKSAVTLQN